MVLRFTMLFLAFFVSIMTLVAQTSTPPGNGDGSVGNPYEIATLDNLYWLTQNSTEWDKHFIQVADIDATETNTWDVGNHDGNAGTADEPMGFSPIGENLDPFTGSYKGQGHIISNLYINRPLEHFVAMFGSFSGSDALIDSLGLVNADVSGNDRVALLVGASNNWCEINSCFVEGTVTGNDIYVGGFIAYASAVSINNSYSQVDVTGSDYVGGFVGHNGNSPTLNDCYHVGSVSATGTNVGGFIGSQNTGEIFNSFWNVDLDGNAGSLSGDDNLGATGLSTIEMQQMCVYVDSAWDFQNEMINGSDNIWGLNQSDNNAYPFLSWQGYVHTETCCGYETPTGSGTEGDPYQIASLCDLKWVSRADATWNSHFIQTADIDATETQSWNNGEGFSPIGNISTYFTGSYDGNGHVISNLYINRPATDYVGLFGYSQNLVFDLGLENVDVTGHNLVGGLVGQVFGGTISNSYVNGSITGNSQVGGLTGKTDNTTVISNSYSIVEIDAPYNSGGIVGFVANGTITNCYSASTISNDISSAGGLIGNINVGSVSNSFYNSDLFAVSAEGTGLTTDEMQQMCVYADSAWDIMMETVNGTDDIWGLNANENNGYPFLAWQGFDQTESCCGYLDLADPEVPVLGDVTGECSVTASAPTTTDNCAGTITGTTTDPLEYTEQGTYTITWTFEDESGNSVTATQNVIIDDVTNPEVPTLETLTGECSVMVTAPTTTDNCAGTITGTTTDPLEYTEQGTFTITWSFDDGNGNTIAADQTVVVDDITDPDMPTLETLTGECSVTVSAPTTTDNCVGTVTGTTNDPLEYTEQGTYTITWTFDDNNENFIEVDQTIVVEDVTDPIISCAANQDVDADDTHTYIVSGTEFDPIDVSDNCEVVSVVNDFNNEETLANAQLPEGTTTIIWTVTDVAGNISTCSFDVIVNEYVGLNSNLNQSFVIYPNPAHDELNIEAESHNDLSILVYNMSGQKVMEMTYVAAGGQLDINTLQNGVYMLQIMTDEKIEILRFVKR